MTEPSTPTVVTYAAAGTSVAASFTASEIGVYGGLLIAVCTFLMNWYYKQKHLELARGMSRQSIDEG